MNIHMTTKIVFFLNIIISIEPATCNNISFRILLMLHVCKNDLVPVSCCLEPMRSGNYFNNIV
jgi:hypothetical protein